MKKKNIINVLLETLYLLIFFAYLLIVKIQYSVNVSYDFTTFMVVSLIIIGVMILCGSHLNKYVGLLLGSIYSLYLIAQRIYYRGFESYFKFSTALSLFDEVADQTGAIKELCRFNDFIPLIVLLLITIVFLVLRYAFKIKTKYRWYIRLSSIICFVIPCLLMSSMVKEINATALEDNVLIYQTDYYIYHNVYNPGAFVERFGLITYGIKDAQKTISGKDDTALYKENIDSYFQSVDNTKKTNDYTGMFEGKNLILIQCESLTNFGISNPELTPTLYNMRNSSIDIRQFETPVLVGSTSDAEFMSNTSFIPEGDGYTVCYEYAENTYPLTLGNIFNSNGYTTNAYHGNYGDYYNRKVTMPNYGYNFFDSYLLGSAAEVADTYISEQMSWIEVEQDKFMAFWITMSGHSPYEAGSIGVNDENVAKVREVYPKLDDYYVYYFAKIMDLDQAIENLIKVLTWTNRLDDTVIILYGDHRGKGILADGNSFNDSYGDNASANPWINRTTMMIWSNSTEYTQIDKHGTAIDILPTICNLWNLDYETKYAFGHDLLDPDYEGYSFDVNGNVWNESFYYDAATNQMDVKAQAYSEDTAWDIVNEFYRKREVCSQILKIDYFAQ